MSKCVDLKTKDTLPIIHKRVMRDSFRLNYLLQCDAVCCTVGHRRHHFAPLGTWIFFEGWACSHSALQCRSVLHVLFDGLMYSHSTLSLSHSL